MPRRRVPGRFPVTCPPLIPAHSRLQAHWNCADRPQPPVPFASLPSFSRAPSPAHLQGPGRPQTAWPSKARTTSSAPLPGRSCHHCVLLWAPLPWCPANCYSRWTGFGGGGSTGSLGGGGRGSSPRSRKCHVARESWHSQGKAGIVPKCQPAPSHQQGFPFTAFGLCSPASTPPSIQSEQQEGGPGPANPPLLPIRSKPLPGAQQGPRSGVCVSRGAA